MGEIDDEPQPSDRLSESPESDVDDSLDPNSTFATGAFPSANSCSDTLDQPDVNDDDLCQDGEATIAPMPAGTNAANGRQTRRAETVPLKPSPERGLVDEACDQTSDFGQPRGRLDQPDSDFEYSTSDFDQPTDTVAGEATQQRIGRYEIKRLLGEGAFGKVFLARDPQLDRIVALKVAKSASGETQIQRFTLEARAAAHLRHPHIIPVYEYGQIDGLGYIVYEFVEGETLGFRTKRLGRITFDSAVDIVREIAEGLHYAHEKGIVHRDMKPDNVMLDAQSGIHIADFGCARSEKEELNLTADDSIIGTPFYMSPEQASGKSNTADGRTDIWSLGVIFYELLSGERPFDGSLQEVLYWICNNDPKQLRKIDRDIPVDLETICHKCLSRDVNDRFLKAGDLADELTRFQNGEPIKSRRVGVIKRSWMWAKRNQAVASLIAAVVTVLLLGASFSSYYALSLRRAQDDHVNTQLHLLNESEAKALPGIFEALAEFEQVDNIEQKLIDVGKHTTEGALNSEDDTAPDKRRFRVDMALLKIALKKDKPRLEPKVNKLLEKMLEQSDDAEHFTVCCELLDFQKERLRSELWKIVQNQGATEKLDASQRFCAGVALANYAPDSGHWDKDEFARDLATDLANQLKSFSQIEMAGWLPLVDGIRDKLQPPLKESFADQRPGHEVEAERAAVALSRLYQSEPSWMVDELVPNATAIQLSHVIDSLRHHRKLAVEGIRAKLKTEFVESEGLATTISRQANMVLALIELDPDYQWQHLSWGEDPSLAAEVIDRIGSSSTSFGTLLERLKLWDAGDGYAKEDEISGILLAMGEFRKNRISIGRKNELKPILLNLFNNHPSARVHSSAKWLMTRLGDQKYWDAVLAAAEKDLRQELPDEDKSWHIDTRGNTFIVSDPVSKFQKGLDFQSSLAEARYKQTEGELPQHAIKIPWRFGICTTEVTVGEFEQFEKYLIGELPKWADKIKEEILPELKKKQESSQTPDPKIKAYGTLANQFRQLSKNIEGRIRDRAGVSKQVPVTKVDFLMALAYCNWVNQQDKPDQLDEKCGYLRGVRQLLTDHERQKHIKYEFADNDLFKAGYRLPTATEWEYACRGKSLTTYPFGRSGHLLEKYAWYLRNADGATVHPVGQLKPSSTGVFDMLGNVSEWCLDFYIDPETFRGIGAKSIYEDHGPEFFDSDMSGDIRVSIGRGTTREIRGGSFSSKEDEARPTARYEVSTINISKEVGFRLARTYPPKKSD